MNRPYAPFLTLAASLALSSFALADVVYLTSSKDNTLYQDQNGALSNGAGDGFFAGRTGGMTGGLIRRGLIAFDVASAIPAGSTVNSVTLTLSMSMTNSSTCTVTLNKVSLDWGEGTSNASAGGGGGGGGAPSTPNDATWIHTFYNTQFWGVSGGAYAAGASASLPVTDAGFYTWGSTAQMVADVQGWLNNPSTSFGWAVIGNEASAGTAKKFDTKENPNPGVQPVLTIDFTPPAPVVYCTAKVNSLGCVPAIGSTGTASATATSGFVVTGSNVRNNKSGILFYGTTGPAATPFSGGTLCVKAPVKRTPATSSGGTPAPANDCSGVYAIDMNAYARGLLGGVPLPALSVMGTVVNCQWWGRDPGFPAPNNTTLTDGLQYVVSV
jgi:hypothetical protein